MLVTVFFPELMFAHAMEERSIAVNALGFLQDVGVEMNFKRRWWHEVIDFIGAFEGAKVRWGHWARGESSKAGTQTCHWTMTHFVYANMGGFHVVRGGDDLDDKFWVLDASQVIELYHRGALEAMPEISKAAIADMGKAYLLLKIVVLDQFLSSYCWLLREGNRVSHYHSLKLLRLHSSLAPL